MKILSLYSPLPHAVNFNVQEMERRGIAWMDRFDLFADAAQRERLMRTGSGRFASHVLPMAREQPLQWATDLFLWSAAFDDEYGAGVDPVLLAESLSRLHRGLDAFESRIASTDRHARALRDLHVRLSAFATPEQVERWVEAMRGWLMTEVWKASAAARSLAPEINDYVVLRMYSGGMAMAISLIPILGGYDISRYRHADPRVRALNEIAALLLGLDRDLISIARDRQHTRDGRYLLDVVRGESSAAGFEPVVWSTMLRDRVMGLFVRLRDQMAKNAPMLLACYLSDVGLALRGAAEWALSPVRGSSSGEQNAELVSAPGHWADMLSGLDVSPPTIPAIAWWWRYDPARRNAASRFVSLREVEPRAS